MLYQNMTDEHKRKTIADLYLKKKISFADIAKKLGTYSNKVLRDAKKGDLVYFDPPYQPVSSTANFTSYTTKDFTYDDLTRLAELCLKLDSKGCNVLLSNSDSKEVSDIFSKKPWKITRIEANRSINSNSKKRTGHFELLIKNY